MRGVGSPGRSGGAISRRWYQRVIGSSSDALLPYRVSILSRCGGDAGAVPVFHQGIVRPHELIEFGQAFMSIARIVVTERTRRNGVYKDDRRICPNVGHE